MSQALEESKTVGPHHQLSKLVGAWKGLSRVWFDPAKLEDESPITGTMRLLMDGRYVLHEYRTGFGDKEITGMAIYGYNLDTQKYQCAWIDSFHTATMILFSEGKKADQKMEVLGSYAYVTPESEQYWGWRSNIEVISPEEIVLTAYNITPDGDETKATEIVYKKVS
ncbi:MAG TPA: DUF1579 domain-containing protein [Flavitalea sp.]|nr:DUF1579 domain-containing protein [Flavitalea sp.]